jgi:hypothetical protein
MNRPVPTRWLVGLRRFLGLFLFGWAVFSGCREKSADKDVLPRPDTQKLGSGTSTPNVNVDSGSHISVAWKEGDLAKALYRNGSERGNFFLPETTGGGIAAIDFDRDGRIDIVCAGGGQPDLERKLMLGHPGSLSRGLENVRFVEAGENAGLDLSAIYNAAIAVADYDADGFSDVLSTGYSGLQLFRNQGDGTLEQIDAIAVGLADTQWSSSAAFFDADNDGLLDLYVANYANWSFDFNPICKTPESPGSVESVVDYCGPREFRGLTDVMYQNLGDGTFRDVSQTMGIDEKLRGLGILAADLDADGDVDLYVANDVDPNLLYRNDGGFQFTEIARRSGVACNDIGIPEGSMGIALGDYNLDGKQDLWVTNYQNEIGALYRNNGKLSFTYASNLARIPATDERSVGWGTAFVDMELDGDEDILVVNGHIELRSVGSSFEQRPQILENIEGKYFRLVPRSCKYLSEPQSSRSLAVADFNQDGLMDYAVNRLNTDAALVLNQSQRQGKWLSVRLIGTRSNRDAIGTAVNLQVGDRSWVRQLSGGGSYAATHDLVLHFGVPNELASSAGELTIAWPSGIRQTIPIVNWDTALLISEGN